MYSPGYAPLGEIRDQRGHGDGHQAGQNRYNRKRPISNKAKMTLMRKCKRY